MKFSAIVALVLTLLAVSACIVEPYGHGGGHYGGGGHERGVWRG